ncbi:MAG: UDP-2,3-diacylglucosamine diphosphatase, partial [Bacteroidota bacterium]
PEILVLNGDIIDMWQFSKHYFPVSHIQVIRSVIELMALGTKVFYITGNHDEGLRKFKGMELGNFRVVNKLLLDLPTGKAWIFHGDVFDTTMKHSKWVAKLGGKGYDLLILLNTCMNWISERMGKGKISFSKKVKDSVKGIVKHINNFEETAAEIAMDNGYAFVVCGHIHQPKVRVFNREDGTSVTYLNSGDWVENMTALEYNGHVWHLIAYSELFKEEPVQRAYARLQPDYAALLKDIMNPELMN